MNEAKDIVRKYWFRALIPGGHAGSGRIEERVIYLYARTMGDALGILNRKARSWKHSKGVISLTRVSDEEASEIEQWIDRHMTIPLSKLKKAGYVYATRLTL